MRKTLLATAVALLCLPALAAEPGQAAAGAKTYAQELADRAVAAHPELASVSMQVTPPKADKPVTYMAGTGNGAYSSELPLLDANRRKVGTVTISFAQAGDKATQDKAAAAVRDQIARRISHVANLVEPASFDPNIPTSSYGQKLVDELLDAHPHVVILALHAKAPGNEDYPIVASNIGRLGKKADEDDMSVITKGESKYELNDTGDRFEVEHPLLDKAGKTIGAVGVVFAYKKGQNQDPLKKEADAIQTFLKQHVTDAGSLTQPAK